MEPRTLPWKHCIHLTLLLLLSSTQVSGSCRILRCNSDFVAATLDLGSSSSGGGISSSSVPVSSLTRELINAGYCSALRSYATCTKRMARACRGDLAYHSAVQGIEDLLIQHRCPRAGPTAQPRPLPVGTLSADACLYDRSHGGSSQQQQTEYLHCGVFGDPHVRTFKEEFHTCAVKGAWPLIDNDFLYVQATSSTMSGRATVVTKITIIFKSWRQCVEQQLYQAELDNVPGAFADGSVSSGERRGLTHTHSLAVRSVAPGRHVQITAAHIATTLVVRQSGRSLGLSVRSPRNIVEAFGTEQDLQLCVWGCPVSQRLKTPKEKDKESAISTSLARSYCAKLLPAKDVYYEACVFDVLASGDVNSSVAAVSALQDATEMIADTHSVHLLPVASAQRHTGRMDPMLMMLMMLTLGILGSMTS